LFESVEPAFVDGGPFSCATCRISVRYPTEDEDYEPADEDDDEDYPEKLAEIHWFAKFPPVRGPTSPTPDGDDGMVVMMRRMFEKEHAAYQQLFPAMVDLLDKVDAPPDCYPDFADCVYSRCVSFC
jgi:hypothetical protein